MLISIADFKAAVNTAISSELGTYTLAPGIFEPAIFVVQNINKDPPIDWERTGLECLIFPPLQTNQPLHGSALILETWEVRLIQWDRSKTLLAAQTKMVQRFPQMRIQSDTRQSVGRYEQLNILITDGGFV